MERSFPFKILKTQKNDSDTPSFAHIIMRLCVYIAASKANCLCLFEENLKSVMDYNLSFL